MWTLQLNQEIQEHFYEAIYPLQSAIPRKQQKLFFKNFYLTLKHQREYSLYIYFWYRMSIHTEEILRTPPPSLSCTEEELTVVSPAESWLSQTSVPSKPWIKNTLFICCTCSTAHHCLNWATSYIQGQHIFCILFSLIPSPSQFY